jgi:hypothetical protein
LVVLFRTRAIGVPLDLDLQIGCDAMIPEIRASFSRAPGFSVALSTSKSTSDS